MVRNKENPEVIEVYHEPLFRSIGHALRFAYGVQDRPVLPLDPTFKNIAHGGIKVPPSPNVLTGWDKHAQSAFILSYVATIKDHYQFVIDGYYSRNYEVKEYQCKLLGVRLRQTLRDNRISPWWLIDVCRNNMGLRRHHGDGWWAEHMGVSGQILERWKWGRAERSQDGAIQYLEDWRERAEIELENILKDKQIIP